MRKAIILLVTISLLLLQHVYAQGYYFRHYQVEDGLSHNTVFCALQDHKGFMWFGTKDGLNRYDGNNFKTFRHAENDSVSIGNNFVHQLFEDSKQQLWIGTESGIYAYLSATEKFKQLQTDDSASAIVSGIAQDSKSVIWFIMGGRLYRYTSGTPKATRVDITGNASISSLYIDKDDIIWLATYETLIRYNTTAGTTTAYNVFNHSPAASSGWIFKIVPAGKDSLLLGTIHQGLKLFIISTGEYKDVLTWNKDRSPIYIRDCIAISEEEFWLASESGIHIYNTRTGSHTNLNKQFNNPYALSDNATYCLFKDREGSIWAGTYFGGVNYFSKQYNYFQKYFPDGSSNSISGNAVREIKEDKQGNLWIGIEDGGLNKLDTRTNKITRFYPDGTPSTLSHYNIHGLAINDNEIWVGTFEQGLDVMDIHSGKILKHYKRGPDTFQSDFIVSLCKISSGEILIGTTLDLTSYDPRKKTFTHVQELPGNNFVYNIIEGKDSTIWVATLNNGLYYYNRYKNTYGNFRHQSSDSSSISGDMLNTLFEDSKGVLWVGTEGNGLCRFNKATQTFTRYNITNGLPSNYIFKIQEDDEGNIWLSTSRGLVRMNASAGSIRVYTASSGLLNDQFNYNSGCKTRDGRLYFGSVKGMISFNPATFVTNTQIPSIYITGLQVNGREIEAGDQSGLLSESILQTEQITLNYLQSSFSIDFAALSFISPEMTQYAYIMHGLDKEWTALKTNRKAYFTNLAAGTYVFNVKANTGNGAWSTIPAQLTIKVLPPPWESAWAYALYTLMAMGIAFYFIRRYHFRQQEKHQRRIELMQHEKEKELYKAKIDFFTNVAHEIKTPLTLIKGPLEKIVQQTENIPDVQKNIHIMERNTGRLVDLTNQLLDFRQTEENAFTLSFTCCNINAILIETNNDFRLLAEKRNITCTLDLPTPDIIAWVDEDAFNKIITNLLSNAIKYAAQAVTISLYAQENNFIMEMTNDGNLVPDDKREKIFEPFYRLKETERSKGTGIGLALSRSLTQLHKGRLYLKPRMNEKVNTFVLMLPLHHTKPIL
ncbi:MAG: two-component regulator propeller domain-containing protein [Agriterribacter sp.]